MKPPETFETARVLARKPRAEDAPAVFAAYASDPEVTRYLSWKSYAKVEPLAEFLRGQARVWETGGGHFSWLLCLRDTDVPIGSIGCSLEGGKMLCGYVLAKRFWGQGLMTEALRWLVDWAIAQPEIFRAYAFCDLENPTSARVMEKAGMTREGILRRWHVCPSIGPDLRDCIICAKTK
jgi:ribosomal-protein-alanine N-acetyltransferase